MTTFKHINIDQARALLDEKNTFLFDVRTLEAFQTSHIKGAHHLSQETLETMVHNTPKDSSLVIYCYKGNSSQQAAAFLCQQGFTNVYSLDGGFTAWSAHYPDTIDT